MGGFKVLLVAGVLAAGTARAQVAPRFFQPDPLRQIGGEVSVEPSVRDEHPAAKFGVMVGLVSVPRPLNAELFVKFADLVGVGASYSALPGGLSDLILSAANVHDASVTSAAFDGEVRLFPFRGSFFVGSALGRQSLTASATRNGGTVNVDMITLYATPRIGWLAIWDSGLSLSIDAGAQIPITTNATVTGTNPEATDTAQSAARAVGNMVLPSVSFRLGFFL